MTDDQPQPLIREELTPYLQAFAAKFDPSQDPRIHGGKGMVPIICPDCEDEGIVYFTRPQDGAPDWMVARCVCSAQDRIPRYPRSCDGMRLEESPDWRQLGLMPDLVWPMRLHPFAMVTGFPPYPCPEPGKGEVKFRRPMFVFQEDERRANQKKYDGKWGPTNPRGEEPF